MEYGDDRNGLMDHGGTLSAAFGEFLESGVLLQRAVDFDSFSFSVYATMGWSVDNPSSPALGTVW